MPLTLTNYDAVLKDLYEGAIREQLNQDVPLLKLLEETDKPWSGRRVVFPVHTTRNSGVGARAERGVLPVAGNQGNELAIVSATYQYARGQVTGQTLAAGKNAFAEALSMEMDGLMNDLRVDLGRQTWGVGDGRLAQIATSSTAATGSTIIPLFNRFVVGRQVGQPGARYISVGQVVDVGAVGQAVTAISQTISAVSVATNPATTTDTVTLGNSAITHSSSEQFLYNRGAGGSGGVGLEMLGLQAIVDDFTQSNMWGSNAFWSAALQGISRSSVARWNAIILANSGTERIVDSNLMQTAFDQIHIETGLEPDLIMGEHQVVRAFLDSVAADRRYATASFDAGVSNLSYNGVAIEKDRLAPYNTLFVGRRDTLKKFTLKTLGFADRDGAILSRIGGTSAEDSYEFFLCMYANLGCQGYMKSLAFIRDIKTNL